MRSESIIFSERSLEDAIAQELIKWQQEDKVRRLWASDASLWTNSDEAKWTGWLNVISSSLSAIPHIQALAAEIKTAGFTDMVLLGMGGSSLFPSLLANTFESVAGYPRLHILDSTDPEQIWHLEVMLDLKKTLFIVSSKSGSTLEPNIFKEYFFARCQTIFDTTEVGDHFIAITDPGTPLATYAVDKKFRAIFYCVAGIGGRYSALSIFGMVPFGLMGLDLNAFLQSAEKMREICSSANLPEHNPGVLLGIILGVCAKWGKNKITLIESPKINTFGNWIEQLLAESTGKDGKGLIPIAQETLGSPHVYQEDRVFIYTRLNSDPDREQDTAVKALEKAGHFVVRLQIAEKYQLAAELFRWEIATVVASSILEINPFDQPDVETSKIRTLQITNEFDRTQKISQPVPLYSTNAFQLFSDEKNAVELTKQLRESPSLEAYLQAHFSQLNAGDYVDLSAFIEMSDENTKLLQDCRILIRNIKKIATCLGFGPRFLHSTGQAYKGGPNIGLFLQITSDRGLDLALQEHDYTFGVVIDAQAQADFEDLSRRQRRVLRLHLRDDIPTSLLQLHGILGQALRS